MANTLVVDDSSLAALNYFDSSFAVPIYDSRLVNTIYEVYHLVSSMWLLCFYKKMCTLYFDNEINEISWNHHCLSLLDKIASIWCFSWRLALFRLSVVSFISFILCSLVVLELFSSTKISCFKWFTSDFMDFISFSNELILFVIIFFSFSYCIDLLKPLFVLCSNSVWSNELKVQNSMLPKKFVWISGFQLRKHWTRQ